MFDTLQDNQGAQDYITVLATHHVAFNLRLDKLQDEQPMMKDLLVMDRKFVIRQKDDIKKILKQGKTSLAKALLFLQFVKRLTKSHQGKDFFFYKSDVVTLFYIVR